MIKPTEISQAQSKRFRFTTALRAGLRVAACFGSLTETPTPSKQALFKDEPASDLVSQVPIDLKRRKSLRRDHCAPCIQIRQGGGLPSHRVVFQIAITRILPTEVRKGQSIEIPLIWWTRTGGTPDAISQLDWPSRLEAQR
jgi:hypothetical protein